VGICLISELFLRKQGVSSGIQQILLGVLLTVSFFF
jgi:hypothetical protein